MRIAVVATAIAPTGQPSNSTCASATSTLAARPLPTTHRRHERHLHGRTIGYQRAVRAVGHG